MNSLLSDPLNPGFISVAQLKVTVFISNLHPTRDKEFLYWFNATYPTGKSNDFPAISLKWLQGIKSLTEDQKLAANAEANAFTQSKFVADAEAYVSKLVSLPHQHAPFIAAVKSSTLKPTFLKAFAAAPVKTPSTDPYLLLQHLPHFHLASGFNASTPRMAPKTRMLFSLLTLLPL